MDTGYIEIRADQLKRYDVLVDGGASAVVEAVQGVEGRDDLVLVRVRVEGDEFGEFEFFDSCAHRRWVAVHRFAG